MNVHLFIVFSSERFYFSEQHYQGKKKTTKQTLILDFMTKLESMDPPISKKLS